MPDSYFTSLSNALPSTHDLARTPEKTCRSHFDCLAFRSVLARLEQERTEQLNKIATPFQACPSVHLTIGGSTDDIGDPAHNQRLAQDRADAVVAQLQTMGIAGNRCVAKEYGDQYLGDDTAEGRALNRRISMLVTAK